MTRSRVKLPKFKFKRKRDVTHFQRNLEARSHEGAAGPPARRVARPDVTAATGQDSPHGVEVVVGGYIVFVVAGQAQLVAVALVDKMPQFFGTEGLRSGDGPRGGTGRKVTPEY